MQLRSDGSMVLTARVVNPSTGVAVYATFRVDTGDDIVLINPSIARAIGASPVGTEPVEGIDGRVVQAPVYVLDLDLGSSGTLTGVKMLGVDIGPLGYDGLFGDDALNRGILIRNGPAGTWSFTPVGAVPPPPPPSWVLPLAMAVGGAVVLILAAYYG